MVIAAGREAVGAMGSSQVCGPDGVAMDYALFP